MHSAAVFVEILHGGSVTLRAVMICLRMMVALISFIIFCLRLCISYLSEPMLQYSLTITFMFLSS